MKILLTPGACGDPVTSPRNFNPADVADTNYVVTGEDNSEGR